MPHRPKSPTSWTNEQALKRLFPKKVREHLKEIAHGKSHRRQPHKQSIPGK